MKNKDNNRIIPSHSSDNEDKSNLKGYPLYPPKDDIYNKEQKEDNVSIEGIPKLNEAKDKIEMSNETEFFDNVSGNDLDIPGSELDDKLEDVGSEDEENNYYSIGGENHDNLEEDNEELKN